MVNRAAQEMLFPRRTAGLISRVKWPEVEADFLRASGDEVKNDWSRTNYLNLINR